MGGYLFWLGVGVAGVGYWKLLLTVRSKRWWHAVRLWLPPMMTALGLLTTAAFELAFSLFGSAWKTPVDLLLLATWLLNYPVFLVTLLGWGSPADQLLGWQPAAIAAAQFWVVWYGVIRAVESLSNHESHLSIRTG